MQPNYSAGSPHSSWSLLPGAIHLLKGLNTHPSKAGGEDPGTALHRHEGASPRQYRPDGETGSFPAPCWPSTTLAGHAEGGGINEVMGLCIHKPLCRSPGLT